MSDIHRLPKREACFRLQKEVFISVIKALSDSSLSCSAGLGLTPVSDILPPRGSEMITGISKCKFFMELRFSSEEYSFWLNYTSKFQGKS